MARKKQGQKRRDPSVVELNGETEVDDMAVAASYAASVYSPPAPQQEASDSNEIDVDSEEDSWEAENDSSDEETENKDKANEEEKKEDDDDSDSDESDIDLAKERAAIEKMEAKESDTKAPPKTEHELDPYQTPLSELEKKFQLSLTVDTKNIQDNDSNLHIAGSVNSHLIQERTIIVESAAREGSLAPLDEGSLLVFRIHEEGKAEQSLIPLGRVFEVFGPVRKPLYTVRLPSPKKKKPTPKEKNGSNKPNARQERKTDDKEPTPSKETGAGEGEAAKVEPMVETPNVLDAVNVATKNDVKMEPKEDSKEIEIESTSNTSVQPNSKSDNAGVASSHEMTMNAVFRAEKLENEQNEPANKVSHCSQEAPVDQKLEEAHQAMATETSIESSPENPTESSNRPDNDGECAEGKKGQEEEEEEVDPWSKDGKYTKYLSSHKDLHIYYVQDEAKIIDAESILRMSARGCDASNVYDEEVVNVNEMYFSDDEEERQQKGRRKNRKSGSTDQGGLNIGNRQQRGKRGGRGGGNFQSAPVPTGFYQQQPQPPHVHAYHNPYPQQPYPGTAPPPPPPPPRNPHHQYGQPYPGGHPPPQPYGAYHYGSQPRQPYMQPGQPYAPHPGAYPPLLHQPPNPYYAPSSPGVPPPPPPPPPPAQHPQPQNPPQQQSDTVYYNYT